MSVEGLHGPAELVLPEVHDGAVDEGFVQHWFDDLMLCATIDEVRLKGHTTTRAGGPCTLVDARAAWDAGQVRAVQVRYRWQNERWLDTVMRDGAGARIVRVGG